MTAGIVGAEGGRAASDALDSVGAVLKDRPSDWPVLIAGPTASGKSALALAIADRFGGSIVNADAIQVWSCWRVLSARPSTADEEVAPHLLYGHRRPGSEYSVGRWLRDARGTLEALRDRGTRAIVVGGTGLYLSALTEGLADIPPTPAAIRVAAMARAAAGDLAGLLAEIDDRTATRIDRQNPLRVMRAWEVQQATGRGMADWQDTTEPALMPLSQAAAFRVEVPRDWLAARIDRRFDAMLADGAVDEVRAVLPIWDPGAPWAQAIGAREIVASLTGATELAAAADLAKAASRQYAKRQRTWFRGRMGKWLPLSFGRAQM
jgi:tRNA dimethylallyltransferase